jgi:divalent metal cation (Fe/Co/Zn/Cd) transporter
MIIGILMIIISLLLVRESRSLLMGEAAGKKTLLAIIALTEDDNAVIKVKRHFSMYLAPEEVILQLLVIFKKNLTTPEITDAVKRIRENIHQRFPHIKQIFIEPE